MFGWKQEGAGYRSQDRGRRWGVLTTGYYWAEEECQGELGLLGYLERNGVQGRRGGCGGRGAAAGVPAQRNSAFLSLSEGRKWDSSAQRKWTRVIGCQRHLFPNSDPANLESLCKPFCIGRAGWLSYEAGNIPLFCQPTPIPSMRCQDSHTLPRGCVKMSAREREEIKRDGTPRTHFFLQCHFRTILHITYFSVCRNSLKCTSEVHYVNKTYVLGASYGNTHPGRIVIGCSFLVSVGQTPDLSLNNVWNGP